jgi:hypothetical protein
MSAPFLLLFALALVFVHPLWMIFVFLSVFLGITEIFLCPMSVVLPYACQLLMSVEALMCLENKAFLPEAHILASILSPVPCTKQQNRFVCVNTRYLFVLVIHSMKFSICHIITELNFS